MAIIKTHAKVVFIVETNRSINSLRGVFNSSIRPALEPDLLARAQVLLTDAVLRWKLKTVADDTGPQRWEVYPKITITGDGTATHQEIHELLDEITASIETLVGVNLPGNVTLIAVFKKSYA